VSASSDFPFELPSGFFSGTAPLYIARAPGRLDLMGGISDYSGGLCLEWPLQVATHCALQLNDSGTIEVHSANAAAENWQERVEIGTDELLALSKEAARQHLATDASTRWAAYVLGAFVVLREAGLLNANQVQGAKLFVSSDVPSGGGVSSSASLEVAAMTAICAACDITLDGLEVARLCQRVENEIVGAPCGIMDQVTVALGRENELLQLLCQPHQVLPFVTLPPDVENFGINSNVKHSVGGGAYGQARCATFMGRRILRDMVPQRCAARWRIVSGQPFARCMARTAFEHSRKNAGQRFPARYESHDDAATTVEPEIEYSLRSATEHPIYEADRVRRFIALLRTVEENDAARNELLGAAGRLDDSVALSLRSPLQPWLTETDLLVSLLREQGAATAFSAQRLPVAERAAPWRFWPIGGATTISKRRCKLLCTSTRNAPATSHSCCAVHHRARCNGRCATFISKSFLPPHEHTRRCTIVSAPALAARCDARSPSCTPVLGGH
jgi:L-arabinokinase